jgi:uncharacterized protein YgiM (DUF1202 family)
MRLVARLSFGSDERVALRDGRVMLLVLASLPVFVACVAPVPNVASAPAPTPVVKLMAKPLPSSTFTHTPTTTPSKRSSPTPTPTLPPGGRVVADSLDVYAGPGIQYDKVGQLGKGDTFDVLARWCNDRGGADWLLIGLDPAGQRWISGSRNHVSVWNTGNLVCLMAPPTPTPIIPIGTVIADKLDVRVGPGTAYPRLTQLDKDTSCPIVGRNGDWWQVQLPDGRKGWVHGGYLEVSGSTASVAYVPAPPIPTPTQAPRYARAIASNRNSFSGDQGAGGWSYLMEAGRNSGVWMGMRFDGHCYRTNNWENDVRICPEGEVHPGQSTRVAYEWQPGFSGKIEIAVHAHKIDTRCGDGIWVGTFRAREGKGMEAKLGEFRISGGDNTGITRTYTTAVDPDNMIYVLIDIYRESTCDMSRVYIDIYRAE